MLSGIQFTDASAICISDFNLVSVAMRILNMVDIAVDVMDIAEICRHPALHRQSFHLIVVSTGINTDICRELSLYMEYHT